MAKKQSETTISPAMAFLKAGNYSAIRKLQRANPSDAALAAMVKKLEPDAVVLWLGVGAVVVVALLAFLLVR